MNLPTFGGKDNEDFSKFKEDIEKGFKMNRITRDKQIIKLRECLKGYARKLVPDSNVTEIKEGMKPKSVTSFDAEIAWYII